ncbi:hypothetical protein BJ138DRAFT_1225752 [Hygrophoropsis aurantiaca]|uniref:Uncharacterized protein n=1 Tax=Hygrophoropsis aurantiaca TaxID=72124 RepID=A0ACB7ZY54_9AGAM|nr:hypothetical protein BJ138DRAFT_1225752 [Hygrophoropsis aurantiaca]
MSVMFPPTSTPCERRLPAVESFIIGCSFAYDTAQGELDYDPFAFNVCALGVLFCEYFQILNDSSDRSLQPEWYNRWNIGCVWSGQRGCCGEFASLMLDMQLCNGSARSCPASGGDLRTGKPAVVPRPRPTRTHSCSTGTGVGATYGH